MSVPRRTPPSISTSMFRLRFRNSGITSASNSSPDRAKSNCLPPWLESTIPSNPASAAITASSHRCTPFNTIFIFVTDRNHFISSHVKVQSTKLCRAITTPEEEALAPLFWFTGATSTLFLRSLSRFPNTGASTVIRSASVPMASARRIMSNAFSRSGFTYSCSHLVGLPVATDLISSKVLLPIQGMAKGIPIFSAPIARPHSPSGWYSLPKATEDTYAGNDDAAPSILHVVSTSLMFTRMDGRSHTREKTLEFSRKVTSSSAAEVR
mmetsp:Transcript_13772/g.34642  ORF Transcript_13772/g.34642 Transcript_13772/m.34642 type:complete len:267 (-) Transcript_13772:423-1223(-)